jgi:hypothetical protein
MRISFRMSLLNHGLSFSRINIVFEGIHALEIAYDDSDKCKLLNKYFSSISKLDEENVTLPQLDSKTNNIIHEIHITENEIIDVIQILDPLCLLKFDIIFPCWFLYCIFSLVSVRLYFVSLRSTSVCFRWYDYY